MPTPLGHALAGFAVGWLAAPRRCRVVLPTEAELSGTESARSRALAVADRWRWPLVFAVAGVTADIDLLVGLHSRYTHSVGAALIVFAVAWLLLSSRYRDATAAAVSVGLSYASHILLDWLGTDTNPPYGIMALWPISGEFYLSPVAVFLSVSRRYWLAVTWTQNAASVARELLVLAPIAAAVLWLRPPVRRKSA